MGPALQRRDAARVLLDRALLKRAAAADAWAAYVIVSAAEGELTRQAMAAAARAEASEEEAEGLEQSLQEIADVAARAAEAHRVIAEDGCAAAG